VNEVTEIWEEELRKKYNELLPIFNKALGKADKLFNGSQLDNLFPDNEPRVISRIKSEDHTVEKVEKKINSEEEFKNWIKNKEFENILFDQNGIGDLIGMRLIFPHIDDYDSIQNTIQDNFITNYLVREHGFKVSQGRDVKNRTSGYTSIHSHVLIPLTYRGKNYEVPLEIQLNSEMMNVWMEKQHDLIYKAQNIDLKAEQYLPDLYAILADVTHLIEKIIFLPDMYHKHK